MKTLKILVSAIVLLLSIVLNAQLVNPDKPEKGDLDLKLEKDWEVETAGDMVFGRIQDIAIGKDGKVYVIDPKQFKIHIFAEDGKYISSFGKKGEGPGEIMELRRGAQLFTLDKSIAVIERGKVHFFSPLGEYIKREVITPFISPRGLVSEDILISAPLIVQQTEGGKVASIKTYNLKNKKETIIENYRPYEKASDSQEGNNGGRMVVGIVIPGVTPMMTILYKSGYLFYGMSDSYLINKINIKTREKLSFSLEGREPDDVPESSKKRLAQRLKDIPQDMVKKIIDGLPKKSAFFMDFHAGPKGMIFVSTPTSGDRSSRAFDIFSPEGKYLYKTEVKVEDGYVIRNLFMEKDTLILALEDEEGELKLVKYKMSLPH